MSPYEIAAGVFVSGLVAIAAFVGLVIICIAYRIGRPQLVAEEDSRA